MGKKQKSGAKFGRNRDRNPASKEYTRAKRWETNKRKRIEKFLRENPNAKASNHNGTRVPDYTPARFKGEME